MKNLKGKHDNLCTIVEQTMKKRGYQTEKFKEYSIGEIDVVAYHKNYVLLFEIKCHKHHKSYRKATEQLRRAANTLYKNQRVFKLMVYYKNNKPQYEMIK